MKRMMAFTMLVGVAMLFSSCSPQQGSSNVSVTEAEKNPDKYKGQRVSWSGKPMVEIKAGDSQPMIVIQPGYIVIPKMSTPIGAYSTDKTLLVEGVYDGVGGELGTFSAGGSQTGGAKLLIVKDATVSPVK